MDKGNKYRVRRADNSAEIVNGRNTMAIITHKALIRLDDELAACKDAHEVDRVLEAFCEI